MSNYKQELQGICFTNESPEAQMFSLVHDAANPNDVVVTLELGFDEPCIFEMDLTKLRRALLPEHCVFHVVTRYDNGATKFESIVATTEGDFVSGFQSGLLFDVTRDDVEHQIWLPLSGLSRFVDGIAGVSEQAHDCALELTATEDELAQFRPQPLKPTVVEGELVPFRPQPLKLLQDPSESDLIQRVF